LLVFTTNGIMKRFYFFAILLLCSITTVAEDGYELWLRYKKPTDIALLNAYRSVFSGIVSSGQSATMLAASEELKKGLGGILDKNIVVQSQLQNGSLVIGNSTEIKKLISSSIAVPNNKEGFIIKSIMENNKRLIVISSSSDIGVLYGVFHLLRLLQSNANINTLNINSSPALQLRLLNHWDNLNRHVERGYAGIALWNWHTLPDYKDPRYTDYARANASIGINGVTVTNVNANAITLTKPYLEKIAALADIFRPYGIRVFLTARFSAPIELDRFKTADPLNDAVKEWWKQKTAEIYQYIPDFGGFLVGLLFITPNQTTVSNRLMMSSCHLMVSSGKMCWFRSKTAPLIFNQGNLFHPFSAP